MFGPDWNVCLSNLLLNKMNDVSTRQLEGCTLYFTNKEKFREKLLPLRNNENIERILYQLNIDPENIKPYNNKEKYSFNRYLHLLHTYIVINVPLRQSNKLRQ